MGTETGFPKSVQPGMPKLGVLPNGWVRAPLGDFLEEVKRPIKMKDETEYDLVTVKRSRGGVVRREHLLGKEISVKSQFNIEAGDFLISKRQIVHGACGIVPKEMSGSIVSNEYSVLIVKKPFDIQFLSYLSESIYFQQTCFHSSIGVHVEKMIFKLDRWLKWPFNLPPLEEQRKIVQILTTWDKTIELTEKMLANSQQQKKALMQQLLNFKKRLPGFTEPLKEYKLGWALKVFCGNAFKSERFTITGIPLIRISNIKNDFSITLNDCVFYPEAASALKFIIKNGDILIAMSGATTGKVGRYFGEKSCYLNQRVGRIDILKERANPDFIFQLLKLPLIQHKILIDSIGGAQPNISSKDIERIIVKLPKLNEQNRIVEILNVLDKEIGTLQLKLGLLKEEKKALMQQLLTGKRRVKI